MDNYAKTGDKRELIDMLSNMQRSLKDSREPIDETFINEFFTKLYLEESGNIISNDFSITKVRNVYNTIVNSEVINYNKGKPNFEYLKTKILITKAKVLYTLSKNLESKNDLEIKRGLALLLASYLDSLLFAAQRENSDLYEKLSENLKSFLTAWLSYKTYNEKFKNKDKNKDNKKSHQNYYRR